MRKVFKFLEIAISLLLIPPLLIMTGRVIVGFFQARGYASYIFTPPGVELMLVPGGWELPIQDFRFDTSGYPWGQINQEIVEEEEFIQPIRLNVKSWTDSFSFGQGFRFGNYLAAPVVRNGSFLVLSFTALSNIVILGWIFYIALYITYREEITLGWGKFISLFKRKGKDLEQEQV